jgi:ATP-dependent exoDNAse (exonuclease V) beta subunit
MPGGRRRLANVRKLMRLGREYEYEHGSDLRGFLALVGERAAGRAAGARESEAPVEGEGLDAVRLMTIHRSKGLEFDTVCVADLGRSVRPPHELVRVSADGRLGLRLSRAGAPGRVSALDYDELGQERREAEELEERRLFYVAMTRARERLILSGATRFESWLTGSKQTGGGPVGWIAPAFVPEFASRLAEGSAVVELGGAQVALRISAPDDVVVEGAPGAAVPSDAVPAPPVASADVLAPAPVPAPAAGAPPPAVTTLSYSALGAYARCGYRFYAERVLGLPPAPQAPEPVVAPAPGAPAPVPGAPAPVPGAPAAPRSALDRGTLIHALLQQLNFRRPLAPDGAAVTATAARLGLGPPPALAEARELAQLIAAFAQSELCARLARATDARREQRFAFPLDDHGVLMTGAIDVLAREPGATMLVVDYKSDRLEGADATTLATRVYGTQRLVYAVAALCAGAESVEVVHCFLERPDALATATYGRDQLPELRARVAALAAGLSRHEFPVSSLPHRALCAGCPAQDGLCTWPLSMTRREAPDTLF